MRRSERSCRSRKRRWSRRAGKRKRREGERRAMGIEIEGAERKEKERRRG
jgi:hypothetical protein